MKKIIVILAVVIVALLITYAAIQNVNKPIKVGVEFNLTGDYSYMGISENKILHFLLANYFKDLNVQIKVVDDKSTVQGVKNAIDTLDKWGAQVIIGGAISKVGVPASIETTKRKIPFLGTTSTSAELYDKKDYYFTTDYSNNIISLATGIMLNKEKTKSLLIVCTNANKSYSMGLANKIKTFVPSYKILTVESRQEFDAKKARNIILNNNIDSVLFTTDSRTTAIIVQKLKDAFPKLKIFGTGWNSDNNLIKFGGTSVEGFESVSTYPKIANSKMRDIEDKYLDTYNESISDFFVFVYNDLVMLQSAVKNGYKDRNGFYQYLSVPREYAGVDGKFYINEFGDAQRNYVYLLYVQNEKWKQEKLTIK